jgi:GT2 family glycosyltransferase
VRRDSFLKTGGFNENLVTCEDVDLCYRIGESHKIICDSTISSVHLGEAKTIRHFYKKERWRGKGSLKGFFHHGVNINEVPSLLLPFYGIFSIMFFILGSYSSITYKNNYLLMASIALLIIPPIMLSTYKSVKASSFYSVLPLIMLYAVYISARTVSAFSKD